MALNAGILNGTRVEARPLDASRASRTIALAWRSASPRQKEFQLLAEALVPRAAAAATTAAAA
jgi:LysR family hydrogen peroxide-inducible transcriptional activator